MAWATPTRGLVTNSGRNPRMHLFHRVIPQLHISLIPLFESRRLAPRLGAKEGTYYLNGIPGFGKRECGRTSHTQAIHLHTAPVRNNISKSLAEVCLFTLHALPRTVP